MSRESSPPATRRCPLCRQPSDSRFRPFCSRGCRDRDLLSWFGDGYRLPGSQEGAPDLKDGHDDER